MTTNACLVPSPHPLGRAVIESNSPTLCQQVIELLQYPSHGGGVPSTLRIGPPGLNQ